jgi:hypothetical protein
MQRSRLNAYRAFRMAVGETALPCQAAEKVRTCARRPPSRYQAPEVAPLPPLVPYQRCTCGSCRECRDNAKWDRIFAKLEVGEREARGMYGCALVDL